MAERKLNINAPLLSVRRFSMKSSISREDDEKVFGNCTPNRRHNVTSDKSDSTLDQVTEPVAVPFQWEQIPGRRKDGNEPEPVEEASVTPRLPPGRVLDAARKPSGNELNEQCEDGFKFRGLPLTDNVTKFESFKDDKDKEGGDLGKDDDEDDVSDYYSDALDTLTMTESFSMTCSVSGLSGAEVKPSGSFSTDAQTRDFMMSRFLPAAKAMTLQPAQFASKKQPMAPQEQRQDKMVVAVRIPPSPNKYLPVTIPHYSQEEEDGGESEDEEQECYDSGSISAKGCGLFPRLCLKNSLCLLNPLPGMKIRTKALMQPKSEIERPVKAASIQPHAQMTHTLKKDVLYKHKSGELPKLTQKNVYKHKSGELPKLTQKVTGVSKRFSYSGNLETMGRLSPSRRSGGISPYRREAPQSPFRGTGFLGVPKEVESFKSNPLNSIKKGSSVDQKVLSHQRTRQGSGSGTPTVEKTLYVDTVSTAEILCSKSNFSDSKEQLSSADLDSEFSFQDIKYLDIVKGVSPLHPRLSGSADAEQSSFSDISLPKDEAGMLSGLSMVEGLNQGTEFLECTKPNDGENQRISDHQTPRVEDLAIVKVGEAESPLPPPLPKSPSESWLWRTLPSVNVQNSHSRTQFLKRKKDIVKPSTPSTKWETIVKTSNPRHDHARYSQELIVHPSQPHKT